MSITKRIGPRQTAPALHIGWRIPLLKHAVFVDEANGSISQAGDDIAITVNAGAGPAADGGVFASWPLEDVLGEQIDRGVGGVAFMTWVQRIASIVEADIFSDTDIFCCVSEHRDLKTVPNMLGCGIRYAGGTKTVSSMAFEFGVKTNLVDATPTGQTQQAIYSHYELVPGQIGPINVIGIPLNAISPFDLSGFFFNNVFSGPLYFSIGAYRSNVATAGLASASVRAMYATTGNLQADYVI